MTEDTRRLQERAGGRHLSRRGFPGTGTAGVAGASLFGCSPEEGVDALAAVPLVAERARIHIDEHQRDGRNAIRISTHVYNTTAETDRVVEALKTLSV